MLQLEETHTQLSKESKRTNSTYSNVVDCSVAQSAAPASSASAAPTKAAAAAAAPADDMDDMFGGDDEVNHACVIIPRSRQCDALMELHF